MTEKHILEDVEEFLRRFITYSEHDSIAVTCWLAHTYLIHDMPDGTHTPRLAILAPKKECGKSTVLDITGLLLKDSVASINISPAALYRMVEKNKSVIQLDETDQRSLEDKLELIHAGFKKGKSATVYRCNEEGEVVAFNVFGALMFAAIDKGQILDTTSSRSICIRMPEDPNAKPFRLRLYGEEATKLQQRLEEWCLSIRDKAQEYVPEMPSGIVGRKADKWEILFTIADLTDADRDNATPTTPATPVLRWGARVRQAALALEGKEKDVTESTDGELLRVDINYIIYNNNILDKYMWTEDLIKHLSTENDKWKYYNGVGLEKQITGDQIRRLLRPYGVRPEKDPIRMRGDKKRGYEVAKLRLPNPRSETHVADVADVATPSALLLAKPLQVDNNEVEMTKTGVDNFVDKLIDEYKARGETLTYAEYQRHRKEVGLPYKEVVAA
jgi:putative DNA primase/helicase